MPNRTAFLSHVFRLVWSTLCISLFTLNPNLGHAQETPPPSIKSAAVRITFLPPPYEGTLSVGVYDRAGKLVRSLHREATLADFTTGLNGLITSWDGKDDNGNTVPNGKYRVRGLTVGDLELTGEAFHGNDWVSSEEGPRPIRFHKISLEGKYLVLEGSDSAGQFWKFLHTLSDGSIQAEALPENNRAVTNAPEPVSCAGKDGTRWAIEKVLGEPIVVQIDAAGEVARRLSIGAGEPAPQAIAASTETDEVFLLERDGERWRLRGLRPKAPPQGARGTPTWEVFLEKNRWPSAQYSEVAARVGRTKPFVSEPKITVKTQPNPLIGTAPASLELTVATDANGSFLKSSDGLLLRRLTDTTRLNWAVLGHDLNQPELVLLQSDGAVVEEYRIRHPSKLMSFDAGEYLWPPK